MVRGQFPLKDHRISNGKGVHDRRAAGRTRWVSCTLMTLTMTKHFRASRPWRIQELGTMLYVEPNMFGFTRHSGGQALLLLRMARFVLMEWCAIGLRE